MTLLTVEGLTVSIGETRILDGVSLSVDAGEVLGLVGESGSGKSMTALSIMHLLPQGAVAGGTMIFDGKTLDALDEDTLCGLRGNDISMIFQEPMTALNPVMTIGAQIVEAVRIHRRVSDDEAEALMRDVLLRVDLPPEECPPERYPHELSGGQRQRVVIAMAIVLKPKLIIADEPTTALDVTTQALILDLLRRLVAEDDIGLILISHDLGVVADMADRVAIMRNGAIVESGETVALFRTMQHPYSRMLRDASTYRPALRQRVPQDGTQRAPLLEARAIVQHYRLPRATLFGPPTWFRALDDVGLTIHRGENLGLVGESGSGKSTLARIILALTPPVSGTVMLDGRDFLAARGPGKRDLRRHIQAVFQDPYGSFDPRYHVAHLIAEPFHLDDSHPSAAERRRRVDEALTEVGLTAADGDKYPHEFSGGQRQRLAIARALVTRPSLIVLDEAVSALDVSSRAQVLDLLAELSDRLRVSYLFIAHDLSVVRAVTDRVVIMREGRIVEHGETEAVFANPRHPYTAALIAATPNLERALAARTERNLQRATAE